MCTRLLRTLVDGIIQLSDVPIADRFLEKHISAWANQLARDVPLDIEQWGTWGESASREEQLGLLTNVYFPAGRGFARAN